MQIDFTHDLNARSWLQTANYADCDFPIQNLPFGVFRRAGGNEVFRCGVAIGDQILDVSALCSEALLVGVARDAALRCANSQLNEFLAAGPVAWRQLRHALFELLHESTATKTQNQIARCLVPQAAVEYTLPCKVGDFTDFYTSYYHADNIGKLFDANRKVSPNFHYMPIGYHGRSSSIVISGSDVHRPRGQTKQPDAEAPKFGPTECMDYEMELGFYVGTGNRLGESIHIDKAEERLFGVSLLNDWSARDIQAWELTPIGPFLGKNYCTTVSPWIVTMEALAPFRMAWSRDAMWPNPMANLDSPQIRACGAIDIKLETWLQTPTREAHLKPPVRLARTSFVHQHWTIAQMLAHHTENGCNLQPGDLLGTGTVSGPTAAEAAAMMELTKAGLEPLLIPGGDGSDETRGFLQDGDTVILKGWCERPGFIRIGLGQCSGRVIPSSPPSADNM